MYCLHFYDDEIAEANNDYLFEVQRLYMSDAKL